MDYYRKNIRPFIRSLISDHIDLYGIDVMFHVEQLSDTDLNTFARLLMDQDNDLSFLLDDNVLNILARLCLRTDDCDDKLTLGENVLLKIITHYKTAMEDIIVDEEASIKDEFYSLNGYRSIINPETGDNSWVKSC